MIYFPPALNFLHGLRIALNALISELRGIRFFRVHAICFR